MDSSRFQASARRRRPPRPRAGPIALDRSMAVLAGLVLLYLSWQALHWIPLSQELAGDLLILPLGLVAAWAAWRASRRAAGSRRLASAWRWVALALAAQAAGSVAQLIYEHALGSLAYPSVADLLYLSFYPLLLVGILRFPAAPRSGREALDLVLDCAIVTLGGGAAIVYFVLGPDAVAAGTPLETATSMAYPIGDMILLAGLGAALLRSPLPELRASLRWMTAAIALFVVADTIYDYVVLHGTYHGGDPLDTLYVLAFACFAIAAWLQPRALGTAAPPRVPAGRVGWIPYAAVVACLAIVVASQAGQPFFPDLAIALLAATVMLLVLARLILSLRSVRRSEARLAADLAHRRRMETQLRYQADHDALTGLHNRRHFAGELDRVLRYASRYHRPGAVLVLDVDNLTFVNDARGHGAGDAALKAVAAAIAGRARETDVLGRIGGDEFAVVLPEADEQHAHAAAESIRHHLGTGGGAPLAQVSVGIALFDGTRELLAEEVLSAADVALYEAKEGGRDQVRVHRGGASQALTWVERIRTALAEERLVLYAQPILSLQTNRVARRELLVRMLDDDGAVIPPGAFLPTAERFGLVGEIDRWVVREGLLLARRGERVSINLSAASIGDDAILRAVCDAVAAGLDPANAIFEITETAAMTNMAAACAFTEALTRLGCDVALDDFGTGFASFTYLKHLPSRYVKIDLEFVRDMVWNPTDQQVVKSVNAIAHSLGKHTIAEGVEDEATLAALRMFGVDCAQGYHIGRPERISPPTRFEQARGPGVLGYMR